MMTRKNCFHAAPVAVLGVALQASPSFRSRIRSHMAQAGSSNSADTADKVETAAQADTAGMAETADMVERPR